MHSGPLLSPAAFEVSAQISREIVAVHVKGRQTTRIATAAPTRTTEAAQHSDSRYALVMSRVVRGRDATLE
jgi:hypothetical protein